MSLRIGIPVPTSGNHGYNDRCYPQYSAAISASGGVPVRLELGGFTDCVGGSVAAEVRSCAGFVLPGSPADVDPALYGQESLAASASADPERERCDTALLQHAAATGKPVLAVCFGMQMLNVWCGGTLLQDLSTAPVDHRSGGPAGSSHAIHVDPQSLLSGLLTRAEAPLHNGLRSLVVNTSHHQAVSDPGERLAAVAHSSLDGVVEAIEGRIGTSAMLGVQWHPERSFADSAASRALFRWLLAEAEDWASRRELTEGADGNAF